MKYRFVKFNCYLSNNNGNFVLVYCKQLFKNYLNAQPKNLNKLNSRIIKRNVFKYPNDKINTLLKYIFYKENI